MPVDFDPHGVVIIVGVSARSAAASCVRAGQHAVCLDLFGDRDLRNFCHVQVLRDLDEAVPQLEQLAVRFERSTPIIYTGGIENRPDVIEHIESHWRLCGCDSRSVRAIRDPLRLAAALRARDCPALDVQLAAPSDDGRWLRKPLRSGGGLGISTWHGDSAASSPDCYFQEHRIGLPMSALFAASASSPGSCELIGVCRQLIGESWLYAPQFGWCGAIGDIDIPADTRRMLLRIGQTLHVEFGVAGLIGIDFVLDDNGVPWVTEVNPRYTGSTEVLEQSTGRSLMRRHLECFSCDTDVPNRMSAIGSGQQRVIVGKAVLFAPRDLLSNTNDWSLTMPDTLLPAIVDIPAHGQSIPASAPICTVLVQGETESECENALRAAVHRLDAQVAHWKAPVRF